MSAEKERAHAIDGADVGSEVEQESDRESNGQSDGQPPLGDQLRAGSEKTTLTAEDVRARMKADRYYGSRPLQYLVNVEAELHARSAALAKLSSPVPKHPDKVLLTHQLVRTVNTNYVPHSMAPQLRSDAIALYASLQSRNPIESIENRLLVGMLNSVMHCHARAAATANLKAIDISLRHAEKGTRVIAELLRARKRRRSSKKVTVGEVNVNAGGQAIVGNVEARKKRSQNQT
jgi:hypothetical protein